jgi:FOG: WD40 repeat
LSGKAVLLSHHARSSEFLDLDYDIFTSTSKNAEVDSHLKRVFVVSNLGMLFQINYESAELEGVLQLHDSGINSIVVTEGYCVTGSNDCFLRVWPLDFSEYLLEAKHEGPVVAVDISTDRFSIICGTSNCTIGSLDMSTNAYRTLLRSHTAPILAIDIHPITGMLLTASSDKTLRI